MVELFIFDEIVVNTPAKDTVAPDKWAIFEVDLAPLTTVRVLFEIEETETNSLSILSKFPAAKLETLSTSTEVATFVIAEDKFVAFD